MYVDTYIHKYIPIHVHHTYKHTFIHTCICYVKTDTVKQKLTLFFFSHRFYGNMTAKKNI